MNQSSIVNNHYFPFWNEIIFSDSNFYLTKNETEFVDNDFNREKNLALIEKYELKWKRLSSFQNSALIKNNDFNYLDIRQGISKNCSLVVSLIILGEYANKHKTNYLADKIYPLVISIVY